MTTPTNNMDFKEKRKFICMEKPRRLMVYHGIVLSVRTSLSGVSVMHTPQKPFYKIASVVSLLALGCGTAIEPTDAEEGLDAELADLSDASAVTYKYEVTALEPDQVVNGTTLFAEQINEDNSRIVEVNMLGEVQWSYEVTKTNFEQPMVFDVELTPDNTILFVTMNGIYEVNRDGKTIWEHKNESATHDVDRLENGNTIYAVGWAERGSAQVVEVNTAGETVWSWDGMNAFSDAEFAEVSDEGWMHVNGVQRLDNGNTLVTVRNFQAVVEIDADGEVLDGFYFDSGSEGQLPGDREVVGSNVHDAEYLDGGSYLAVTRRPARAVVVTPGASEVDWAWPAEGINALARPLEANRVGVENTLIADERRIIEVNAAGQVVWQLEATSTTLVDRSFRKVQRIAEDGTIYGH